MRPDQLAQGLLESAPDPIVVVDHGGTIVLVNREAERSFGYRRDELLGQSIDLLVPDAQRAGHESRRRAYVTAPRTRPMGAEGARVAVRRRDGTEYPAEVSLSPLETGEGLVIAIVRDVSVRLALEAQLRYLATHDALTGLFNRAYLDAECARVDRGRAHPIGVLTLDADGLKRLNDAEGHDAGDALLCRIASVLASSFRGDDVVARVGGDEFTVLLPGHDAAAVRRARTRLEAAVRAHATQGPTFSVSIGEAVTAPGEAVRDALRRADLEMLADKRRGGRGRDR